MSEEPRLDYVVLRCADLERSRAFYSALGLAFVSERHGRGVQHHSCNLGTVVLDLYPSAVRSGAVVRLGLRVPSVARAIEEARRVGAEILRVGPEEPPSSAVLRDPDGHEIALTDGGRAEPSIRERVIHLLEVAVLDLAARMLGGERDLTARFSEESGRVDIHQTFTVVAHVEDAHRQVSLEDARRCEPTIQMGGRLTLRLPRGRTEVWDEHVLALLRLPREWERFDRESARQAKEIVLAAVRDWEREP